jgi:rhamnosyl/mannosyltransferase
LPYLIEAARKVDARFVLVGSGPMQSQLEAQIATLGLGGKVQLAGEVDDETLSTLYAAADVVVLPSTQRSEAFGIVLLEAMTSGRPVISTELGTGTSWVNQNDVTGLVVKPSDPAALAGALSRLLSDALMRERFGQACRQRVEAEFSEEQMVERVAAIYRQVPG